MATIQSPFGNLPLSGGTLTGSLSVTGLLTLLGTGHLNASGTGIGSSAGANAGTGPPAPVMSANASDTAGQGTFGTGTTPAAGAMVNIGFGTSYTNIPYIVLCADNTAAQALGLYVSAAATNGFSVSCTTAPAASQANSTYSFSYVVIGAHA